MGAAELIPQAPPMRMVETLLEERDGSVLVLGRIAPDCPFVCDNGLLSPAGLMEMAAQSCACLQGLRNANADKAAEAFLVGLKQFTHDAPARAGDTLLVRVTPSAELDGFFLADARITRDGPDGPQIAAVRVKAYCPPQPGAGPHAAL